jgi:serine protease Do
MTLRPLPTRVALLCLVVAAAPLSAQPAGGDQVNEATEQAMRAAVLKVAPSVVKIETSGGAEVISAGPGQVRKGMGPTTGLVVDPDGYVITSAFNFANKPSDIFVSVPGQKERRVAKVVATDQTRMLTLIKIDATGLPVPPPVPRGEIQVGQWSLAVGRTLEPNIEKSPSVSAGIISATGRIWGRAIQTDAKVSPVNYGGPLVDVSGRVQGVLVPASPRGEGETAGVEWYDSGIGFAVPFEDVLAVLPRLKKGDLRPGLLGVTPQTNDQYGVPPTVGAVSPESAAERLGVKPGDVILEIDGKKIHNQTQLRHALGPKYEGDTVSLKVKRGDETIDHPKVVLTGKLAAHIHAFLGILPMRDDPEPGVAVRYVYPKSPADTAGLKAGDRIMKIAPAGVPQLAAFTGRDQLIDMLNVLQPNQEVKFEVKRKEGGKTETLTARLAVLPDEPPEKLPEGEASAKKALERLKPPEGGIVPKGLVPPKKEEPKKEEAKKEEKKVETGLIKRKKAEIGRESWLYVPKNYDPNVSHAMVVWLHAAGKGGGKDADDMVELWEDFCAEQHIILLGPISQNDKTGWTASEAEYISQEANELMGEYTIDRQRVVVHGQAVGGEMAFYLGFNGRDWVRGVATTGAVLRSQPKENVANLRLALFVVAGGKDPIVKEIAEAKPTLTERKLPNVYREVANMGREYLDLKTYQELLRWIDSLDRI